MIETVFNFVYLEKVRLSILNIKYFIKYFSIKNQTGTARREHSLQIRYEDSDLLVVDQTPGRSKGSLVNAPVHHCPDLVRISGSLRPGIVSLSLAER